MHSSTSNSESAAGKAVERELETTDPTKLPRVPDPPPQTNEQIDDRLSQLESLVDRGLAEHASENEKPTPATEHTATASQRAPSGPWLKTWLVAAAMTLALVCVAEVLWRERGHQPSIVDSHDLWAYHRGQIYDLKRHNVVLLGSSRIHEGFSTGVARDRFPNANFVQLAISGTHCIATLWDLAEDDRFAGTVICEVTPAWLRPRYRDTQREYVEYYHRQTSLDRGLNLRIGQVFQQRLAVLHPNLSLVNVTRAILDLGRLPKPSIPIGDLHRSIEVDYVAAIQRDDTPEKHAARMALHRIEMSDARPTPTQWLCDLEHVESAVKRIRGRGGRVVFVRYPVSGDQCALEEELYPRREFWDSFAAMTSAETIHFADEPRLADFTCPEGSHLDVRDVPRFTHALLDELQQREILSRGNTTSKASTE
jgi:hypothetical protein